MAYSDRAPMLVNTAAEIASLKKSTLEARVLSQAKPQLVQTGYDNWDGGIDIYTLLLQLPLPLYVEIEEQREALEKNISSTVRQLTRADSGASISEVVISPALVEQRPGVTSTKGDLPAAEGEADSTPVPSFWAPGHFRLFVSHASEKKQSAHNLKKALAQYGVAAFVAHDDIEPTREWQAEIETALRTMDALAALVSPAFSGSKWCDQEVGTAIGRGRLVVPLCVGADPYGLMGKFQGLQTKGLDATQVASNLMEILIKNDASSERATAALVERLVKSPHYATSKLVSAMLAKTSKLTTVQAGRLLAAIVENPEVGDAFGVPEQLRALVSRVAPAREGAL